MVILTLVTSAVWGVPSRWEVVMCAVDDCSHHLLSPGRSPLCPPLSDVRLHVHLVSLGETGRRATFSSW